MADKRLNVNASANNRVSQANVAGIFRCSLQASGWCCANTSSHDGETENLKASRPIAVAIDKVKS